MIATEITPRPSVPALAVDEAPQRVARWPLFLIAAPAAVAVWSGWVGLGGLCGFGIVHPLPGIADGFRLNTAITLPVGVEAYGAYALGAWLTPGTAPAARTFARRSALGALALGMAGQVIYHLLAAAHAATAPWPVVMLVSCLPVLTLGFGAALTHLLCTGPAPYADADTGPDTTAASTADTAAARPRTPGRTRRGQLTAARVAALHARHPDMSAAEIAARLKVSDRTVRRHLSAISSPDSLPVAAA
jgi:DNA binding protein with HTH domain